MKQLRRLGNHCIFRTTRIPWSSKTHFSPHGSYNHASMFLSPCRTNAKTIQKPMEVFCDFRTGHLEVKMDNSTRSKQLGPAWRWGEEVLDGMIWVSAARMWFAVLNHRLPSGPSTIAYFLSGLYFQPLQPEVPEEVRWSPATLALICDLRWIWSCRMELLHWRRREDP